jgi:hypothetical protein
MMASTLKKRWRKPVPDKLPILLLGMATEHQQCGADDLLLFAFFNAGQPAQGKRLGQVFSKTTDSERIITRATRSIG